MFASFDDIEAACRNLPAGDDAAAAAVRARQVTLTKPLGSLGRLEEIAEWLACWQGREMPKLDRADIIIFAANHGIAAHGVSPYPISVTAQMVANYAAGGAGICRLAETAGARLKVVSFDLDMPTQDFTTGPAMTEAEFAEAVSTGYEAVEEGADLLAVGEMGIGNTTASAAIAAGLFGGSGAKWAGRGAGVDDAGVAHKARLIDAGVARNKSALGHPLHVAAALGGRELAAMLGATIAARHHRIPMLLDGFVCTAAAAPLAKLVPGGLDHTLLAHLSAESGHRALAEEIGQTPLLNLGMRLGEASGAAVAIPIVRAAVSCHVGMATFAEAGVDDRI